MLITGTTRGLGKFLSEQYAAEGWEIVGFNRDSREVAAGARFSAMILNAGMAEMAPIALQRFEKVEEIFQVNALLPFKLMQEAPRFMPHGGRIVAIGTIAVPAAFSGEAAYASSKAALHELVRVASREFGPFGVTVNCVAPCLLDGGMASSLPDSITAPILNRQAIKRKATFSDVKNSIDFFLSEKADMITGQILYMGGPW